MKKVQECFDDVSDTIASNPKFGYDYYCQKGAEEIAHCEEMYKKYEPCIQESVKTLLLKLILTHKKHMNERCSIEQQYEEDRKNRTLLTEEYLKKYNLTNLIFF